MTRDDIEQRSVWEPFFANAPEDQYAVFMHSSSGIQTSWLPACTIIPTLPTTWGSFSLVEVQQALFEAAYMDESTTKFVLLSGDSIPLYTFRYIYAKLSGDAKGYMSATEVTSISNKRERTVNKEAWPPEKPWKWDISSQWIILNRSHVQLLHDQFPMLRAVFQGSSTPDEHVYIVFFTGYDVMDSFHRETPMYVNLAYTHTPCKVWHRASPLTHHGTSFSRDYVKRLYTTNSLFVRKICSASRLAVDFTSDTILVASRETVPTVRPKHTM